LRVFGTFRSSLCKEMGKRKGLVAALDCFGVGASRGSVGGFVKQRRLPGMEKKMEEKAKNNTLERHVFHRLGTGIQKKTAPKRRGECGKKKKNRRGFQVTEKKKGGKKRKVKGVCFREDMPERRKLVERKRREKKKKIVNSPLGEGARRPSTHLAGENNDRGVGYMRKKRSTYHTVQESEQKFGGI